MRQIEKIMKQGFKPYAIIQYKGSKIIELRKSSKYGERKAFLVVQKPTIREKFNRKYVNRN